ncbi:FAST kinase domain-containing protein 5, mitochondrial-like [Manduca sexta]|uniref:FAST kinase domain-containing protein 5, mitochondrial-like n=1 Tax=Manduca sexta TaxID=7130 RepID=UPI00188FE5B1|nr:FAST kinase domain-containing protein 5, mitochondrial-like [Manduca sexta]
MAFMNIARNLAYSNPCKQFKLIGKTKLLHKCIRNISITSLFKAKMHMEYENKYAFTILENKGYANSLISKPADNLLSSTQVQDILQTDWSNKSPSEVFKVFPELAMYSAQNNLCLSNTMFDKYIDTLTDNIASATDKELESLFYTINLWPDPPSIRTRNYIEVWAALDDECLNRVKQWSNDQLLNFITFFYMISVIRMSDFCVKTLNKLATKIKQLTPAQVVQTTFFVGVMRKQPFDMYNIEHYLNDNFTSFTVDDLAIMSMGFFKSKTPIRNLNIVYKIINIVMENANTIHEVSLAALLKIIRYSLKITVNDAVYQMLDVLQHQVPRLSVMCNVHLALVGTATLTLHKGCLSTIAEHTITQMSKTRMKDLERLVLSYGTFTLKPDTKECFFTKVMDELRKAEREEEILKHGRSFACCVSYLGLLGIYPIDLMSKALSKDFLTITYGKQIHSYGREILVINNMAEIFCSNAQMNRLDKRETIILAKKYTDFVPSEDYSKQYNVTERMMLDVMKVLKDSRGGNEFVVADHILPHHQRGDIILCNDAQGKPLPVKDSFSNINFGVLRRPPDKNKWIVLVIAGRNAILYGTDIPTGYFHIKVNELRKLGFHAALVRYSILFIKINFISRVRPTQQPTIVSI